MARDKTIDKKVQGAGDPHTLNEILATVFPFIAGILGAVVFFITLLVQMDNGHPEYAILGSVGLIGISGLLYFLRSKQKRNAEQLKLSNPLDADRSERLEQRMENLELLICRLDRELNHQIEQSLIATSVSSPSAVSQRPTSLLNVASALEERFQILRELGHGGMGVVIQAYDKQLKEQVAIKVLSPLLSCDAQAVERLRREVSAARRITHPNVIRIHDISEVSGLSYVSMEYFEGVNLKEFLRQNGPLSIALMHQIVSQICDGLQAAHDQGVIHRDLKSQNIIINRNNQIKIIDFGLARSERLDGMTATGLIMGTPEYMAPEQVAGKVVDERADIYSFGIILYELMTGTVPFTGESAISVGFKQIKDDPPSPRSLNPSIPEELEGVILKALQKEPSQRYRTCAELRKDFEKILGSAPPSVPATNAKSTPRLKIASK
jgi:serine/threonine protein kinase